jgi:hypothetical protein
MLLLFINKWSWSYQADILYNALSSLCHQDPSAMGLKKEEESCPITVHVAWDHLKGGIELSVFL